MSQTSKFLNHIAYSLFGICMALWVYALYCVVTVSNPLSFIILTCGIAYFLGTIPTGLLVASWLRLGDLRKIGSGNIGATNVLRTGNKIAAFVTLLGDALKGTVAVLLYYLIPLENLYFPLAILFGFFAFIGHIFPIWLGFSGGKGVATYLGILFGLNPLWGLFACLFWIGASYISKISSLGAICASLLTPLMLYFIYDMSLVAGILALMSLILIMKHLPNIKRIINGTEPKISFLIKKESDAS